MSDSMSDYLVIGAGPAGLQLAHLLQCDGRDYLVLDEGAAPGGFFATYPRHRRMISNNKRHTGSDDPEFNLRMDWNSLLSDDPNLLFTRYSECYFPRADDMLRYLADFAAALDLRIKFGCRIVGIARESGRFTVADNNGELYRARRVIVATGVSVPNIPEIPGIDLAEHYAMVSVNPVDFTDQRVLIIGKGNAAFETADNLIATASVVHVAGPNPVRLAWHTHFVGHLRAVNNNFLDTYELKNQNVILDVGIERIRKVADGYQVQLCFTRGLRSIGYDRVIVCTGFRLDTSIFDQSCRPALAVNGRFPELTGRYESTNVDGLYFAGTLTQQVDYRKSTSGFIHGFRYGARALCRVLNERYHDKPWPHAEMAPNPDELAVAILDRINRSSGLWQQFGVLADVVVVPGTGPARYYEEIPVRHLQNRHIEPSAEVFAVTLEYGPPPQGKAPFDGTIVHATDGMVTSFFHPVIRRYRAGELVDTHHLASDVENDWRDPDIHVAPLLKFMASSIVTGSAVNATGAPVEGVP